MSAYADIYIMSVNGDIFARVVTSTLIIDTLYTKRGNTMDGIDDYNEKMFKKIQPARLPDDEAVLNLTDEQVEYIESLIERDN